MSSDYEGTAKVTLKIIDATTWEAQVVACPPDFPDKHKRLFHREFRNYPTGTLLDATVRIHDCGISIPKWEVVSEPETAVRQEVSDDPYAGWQDVGGVWFSPLELAVFNALTIMLEESPANLLICGPSGYGKTARAKAWAEAHGMDFIRINVALTRDTEEFFGYREAREGSTVFEASEFTKIIRRGNAVVLLDEINRAEAWILNALFPVLDYERGTIVHNERVDVGDNVLFIATANIGLQFVGTFESDAALLNRMDARIEVVPPPEAVEVGLLVARCGISEDDATNVVRSLARLRSTNMDTGTLDISTRSALKLARLIRAGLPIRNAFEIVVINNATEEMRKDVIDLVNVMLGELVSW